MKGICIKCGQLDELIQSHVISKFMGRRVYRGPAKSRGFTLVGGTTPPGAGSPSNVKKIDWKYEQDLPKPYLMCSACDGSLSKGENRLAALIDGSGILSNPEQIYSSPCLVPTALSGLEGFSEYQLPEDKQQLLRRNGIITCWRALHATARSSLNSLLTDYLQSSRGRQMNRDVNDYISSESRPEPGYLTLLLPPLELTLELAGPQAVAPHGWDVMIYEGNNGSVTYVVAVWFAHWMLLWVPDKMIDDPVVADMVAKIYSAKVASEWPLNILKPRVDEAAARLEKRLNAK